MPVRNPDGTFRNSQKPIAISPAVELARWLEAESLGLRRKWLGLEQIAQHVMKVARGQERPLVPLPDGVNFPPGYKITFQGIDKAVKRACDRIPDQTVREHLALDLERIDEIAFSTQRALAAGEPDAAATTLRCISLRAQFLGYSNRAKKVHVDDSPSSAAHERGETTLKKIIDALPPDQKRQFLELVDKGFDLLKRGSEEQ